MENRSTTSSYFNSTDEASMRSKITLSGRVETTLEEICRKRNRPPISDETRQRLSSIPEDLAFDKVMIVLNYPKPVRTIDGLIKHLVNQSSGVSPAQSPIPSGSKSRKASQEEMSEAPSPKSLKREGNGRSLYTPQVVAMGELEFKKAFLLLSYIPGQHLEQVIVETRFNQREL